MPIAASRSAHPPKTVITHMLNFWRDTETCAISSIERTSDTGKPVACRNLILDRAAATTAAALRPDDPRNRRQADVQCVGGVGHLRLRDPHLRLRLAVEPAGFDVGDDADDLTFAFGGELAHHALADDEPVRQRIGLRPVLPRHGFVDDDDWRRRARVPIVERPSALDRDLEDFEVAGRHRHPPAAAVERTLAVGRQRPPDDPERRSVAALQRNAARGARVLRRPESSAASRRRCGRPARLPPPFRTARLSSTSSASGRCGCRIPGSTRPSATAVRIRSAEPISSTSASATSTTTSTERTLFCRKPVPDRPALSFSVVVRSVFEL